MTDQERIEKLTAELAELSKTVSNTKSEFDYDRIEALFTEKLAARQAAEVAIKRAGETEILPVGATKAGETLPRAYKGLDPLDLYIMARHNSLLKRPNSEHLQKAMDSTTSGSGDQLVPTELADMLWPQFYLESRIAPAIGPMVMMPSNPYNMPLWSTFTWYKTAENTATTASNPTTALSTMTGTELVSEVDWSYTLDELSVIPMLPNLRSELVRSGAAQLDAFLLNADATTAGTGNINSDDAAPAATDYYLSAGQDGIRHYWLVDDSGQGVDAGGDALAESDITSALALMGKYAARPDDLAMICDVSTYIKGLQNLDGVQTLDKYGPNAVLLTGELAKYRGIPIIISEDAPLTEADGKVSDTAGNNTLGQLSIINRRMWKGGTFRSLMIEVDRDIQKRQNIMVASFYIAVAARDRTSDHSAGVYNILV